MANFNERDKRKRQLYIQGLEKRTEIKNILKDKSLPMTARYKAQIILNRLNKNAAKIRLTNRCVNTTRSQSVLKSFRLSRIELRNLIGQGLINGIKKSSW